MSFVEVVSCGIASVQDLGRRGYRALGVPVSGAMDRLAAAYANALVGNDPREAVIEVIGSGIELMFFSSAIVAVTGAKCVVELDGAEVREWQPIRARAGSRLRVSPPMHGFVTYIAVSGGIDVEPVLGSRATYARAGFGGFEGRYLRSGDRLPLKPIDIDSTWRRVSGMIAPDYVRLARAPLGVVELRVTKGVNSDLFEDIDSMLRATYTVSPQSDRMGYRLEGPKLESATKLGRLPSLPVDRGYVQVPPSGLPIVLMSDSQTTGGYAVALHVLPPDVDKLAQCPPGTQVRFVEVDYEEAEKAVRRYLEDLEKPELVSVEEESEYAYYVS
ncbi:MAG: biotin-dependent carboxyltransferase family protein [Crenarchaeota archaeon]|nr:biotin-dependent carboxyltransferase family protein [Thermoproteota archaeon]